MLAQFIPDMPIARSAVPFGRAGVTVATGLLNLVVLTMCGLAIGWRINDGAADAAAAFGLLLLMRYALSWLGVYLGLLVRNPTSADSLVPLVFVVAMVSNAFVPTSGMPAWLRDIANWNPVSSLVAACRQLFGNPGAAHGGAWPLQHPVLAIIAWSALLILVFAPLPRANTAPHARDRGHGRSRRQPTSSTRNVSRKRPNRKVTEARPD